MSEAALKILVVDDNEDSADMLELALRARGLEVRIAHDGPDALAMVDEFAPHLALLDIGLPGMDGFELAGLLRARPGARLVLVAVTGYGHASDIERALAAGFDAHLVKPVDLDRLAAIVADVRAGLQS